MQNAELLNELRALIESLDRNRKSYATLAKKTSGLERVWKNGKVEGYKEVVNFLSRFVARKQKEHGQASGRIS